MGDGEVAVGEGEVVVGDGEVAVGDAALVVAEGAEVGVLVLTRLTAAMLALTPGAVVATAGCEVDDRATWLSPGRAGTDEPDVDGATVVSLGV